MVWWNELAMRVAKATTMSPAGVYIDASLTTSPTPMAASPPPSPRSSPTPSLSWDVDMVGEEAMQEHFRAEAQIIKQRDDVDAMALFRTNLDFKEKKMAIDASFKSAREDEVAMTTFVPDGFDSMRAQRVLRVASF